MKTEGNVVRVLSWEKVLPVIQQVLDVNPKEIRFDFEIMIPKSDDESWAQPLADEITELFNNSKNLDMSAGWCDGHECYHFDIDLSETPLCGMNGIRISAASEILVKINQILEKFPEEEKFVFDLFDVDAESLEKVLSEEAEISLMELFGTGLSTASCYCTTCGCHHLSLVKVGLKIQLSSSFGSGRLPGGSMIDDLMMISLVTSQLERLEKIMSDIDEFAQQEENSDDSSENNNKEE